MQIIHMIAGPAVGALIGYFTNYIAVKMLFRPLKPIQIGRFTLPFTPGIIPKRKPALAKALGTAVATALFTAEDIEEALLSERMKTTVSDKVILQLKQALASESTIRETCLKVTNEGNYLQMTGRLSELATDKIMEHIEEIEIREILAEEVKKAVNEKLSGSWLGKLVHDGWIDSLAGPIGEAVQNYITGHGREFVFPAVEKELHAIEGKRVCDMAEPALEYLDTVRERIEELYTRMIEREAKELLKQFRVEETVEKKVNEMDIREVEELLLSVMKHELKMVVNLGAVIGLILGTLNLLF